MILLALGAVVLLLALAPRLARRFRQDDEDQRRAERIQREYHVPDFAVEEPKGRKAQPPKVDDGPEITSNYRTEPTR